jgi:acetylornithine deacetylase
MVLLFSREAFVSRMRFPPVLCALTGFLFSSAFAQVQQVLAPSDNISCLTSNNSALFDLHKLLVDTPSVSGDERAVGLVLASFLKAQNFTVELQAVAPLDSTHQNNHTRYNIFAYRGSSRRTPVLVSSHIDTVPPFYPYKLRGRTDIWGRGSVDAKGSVAAQITALLALLSEGQISNDDVALLYVVGEEVNGDGMRAANALNLSWDSVIFGEPTELKLAAGHKGAMLLKITAHGKAGHSGYPWLGENANSMLLPALLAVQKTALPWSDKYGNTTLNIGTMQGGVAANVIAESAHAELQLRLAAGSPEELKKELTKVVKDVDDRLDLDFWLGYGPIKCDTDIDGFEVITVNYGTDIPHLKGNHKRYLYGPGSILVAHSDHEYVEAADLVAAVDGYKRLILGSLGMK